MDVLCFESGGSKLVAALADAEARLTKRQICYRNAAQRADTSLQQLFDMGAHLIRGRRIQAVSFGFGGTVRRSDKRPVICYHEDGWEDIDLPSALAEAFPVPVFVENDCNLAALAEACLAVKLERGTLFYVTIGTGIGGGIVRDLKLLELGALGEAEIGHIVVESQGPPCPCGSRGCLETLCSGPGLSRLAEPILDRSVDARDLMEAFRRGDSSVQKTLEQAAHYLGIALASAINLLVPDVVVLGGGVMKDNPLFLDLIREKTLARVFPPFRHAPPKFLLSHFQDEVVCRGAAVFAQQKLAELEPENNI
jgi:glucokinase